MNNQALTQIEDGFKRLSTSEQRSLIERLIRHLNETTPQRTSDLDQQLALMASDPEIQNELERIEREFSHAEADGLETQVICSRRERDTPEGFALEALLPLASGSRLRSQARRSS